MEFKSNLGIKGHCNLKLFTAWKDDGSRERDANGRFSRRLKEERDVWNTVTNLLDAHVADQMSDSADSTLGWISIGTGSGQGAGDNDMDAVLDQNALTSVTQQAGGDDNDVLYVGDWAAGDGTGAITEAGIFRLNDDATLMFYAAFSVVNKAAGDTLQINWTVTFGVS